MRYRYKGTFNTNTYNFMIPIVFGLGFMSLLIINIVFQAQLDKQDERIAELDRHIQAIEQTLSVPIIEDYVCQVKGQVSLGEFTCTAYCNCSKCCGKHKHDPAYGITKSGTVATEGRTIAVDPNIIPLGTKVYINGCEYIAEDTGNAIQGNRIDIFFQSHEAALIFGKQKLEIILGC